MWFITPVKKPATPALFPVFRPLPAAEREISLFQHFNLPAPIRDMTYPVRQKCGTSAKRSDILQTQQANDKTNAS
jgi:hypothetical protein